MSLIYDTLKEQIGVHEYDGYFTALCPFHEARVGHPDTRPSFMVNDRWGYYRCQSCGAYGTLEYLEKYLGGREYDPTSGRILERVYPVLPKWRKWIDKYKSIEGIAQAAHRLYCNDSSLRSFFERRGIARHYIQGMFGWLDWWQVFPVRDQRGKVIDIVVRADKGKGDAKYVLIRNERPETPVYVPDWERFMMAHTIYVPYGIIDAWKLYGLGLPVLTGVTGQSLSAAALRRFQKHWIIVPDKGEEDSAWKLKIELGSNAHVKELDYPFRTKDPDEVERKFGPEHLISLLGVTKHERFTEV